MMFAIHSEGANRVTAVVEDLMRNQAKQLGLSTVQWSHPEPGKRFSQQKPFVKHFLCPLSVSLTHKYTIANMRRRSLFIHKPSFCWRLCLYHQNTYFPLFCAVQAYVVCLSALILPFLFVSFVAPCVDFFIVSLFCCYICKTHSLTAQHPLSSFFYFCPQFSLSLYLFFVSLAVRIQQGHRNLQLNNDSLRKMPNAFQQARQYTTIPSYSAESNSVHFGFEVQHQHNSSFSYT